LRAVFVGRKFAVTVLVQLLQCGGSIRDFVGVDDAVTIGIEHTNDGRWGRTAALAWTAFGTALTRGRAVATRRWTAGVLGGHRPSGHSKGQRGEEEFVWRLHIWLLSLGHFPSLQPPAPDTVQ
jgi:hypothetical protein